MLLVYFTVIYYSYFENRTKKLEAKIEVLSFIIIKIKFVELKTEVLIVFNLKNTVIYRSFIFVLARTRESLWYRCELLWSSNYEVNISP